MKRPPVPHRKGAIAPLTAILLVPVMAMLAFSVDLGWITHSNNELQAAADASALAAAGNLGDGFVQYYLPGMSAQQQATVLGAARTQASTAAKTYAGYNKAGDVTSLTLLDADIEFGFTDGTGKYTPLPTYTGYPNTVKVTLRRNASANGALPLFFGRVLGINTVDLSATATAALQGGTVNGFQSSTINTRILPMTYDVNNWNNFFKTGQSPDGTTSVAPNGMPDLNIYPSIKYDGNFGELSLDQGNDGASTISNWITNGATSTDLQAESALNLLPLSIHDPNSAPDWKGNPGLKDSTIQTVGANVNGLYLLPLFKPYDPGAGNSGNGYQAGQGNGSNYYYTIVQFVGVMITSVNSGGNNKSINVQPTALISPNALLNGVGPVQPPTNGTPPTTTFVGGRLIN
jgi:Flp pilus assembly protein TadG